MLNNEVINNNYDEEAPELFSESIIQMHNDLKNSPLYPEPKKSKIKSLKTLYPRKITIQ